jgi:heme a synthase
MFDDTRLTRPAPRWLHVWAILTVAITAVPVALGGWVTTIKAGMADPVWPTTPWYLFFADWREPRPGFLIEHAHRLAGYTIGLCAIVLAVGLWMKARNRALRWLGVIALGAVIVQGMLGGFRVVLNELFGTNLAAIHGTFAQIVFSLLVAIAVLTAPVRRGEPIAPAQLNQLRRFTIILAGLVFLQVVWGAILRHTPGPAVQRLHLLTAFVVVAAAVWVIRLSCAPDLNKRFVRFRIVLIHLLALQVLLGVEAWLGKFASGILPDLERVTPEQVKIRIAHVLVGAGVLATSVAFAVRAFLPSGLSARTPPSEQEVTTVPQRALPMNVEAAAQLGGTV